MADETLSKAELCALIERVFRPTADDRAIAILVDLPNRAGGLPDDPAWRDRRALAADWTQKLQAAEEELGLTTRLYCYPNVGANNADLPEKAWRLDGTLPPLLLLAAEDLDPRTGELFADVFASHDILIALTELSTTAPLKLAAPRYGFRAATMPGFSAAMIPALRLDYGEIDRRVRLLKGLLDGATGADFVFTVDGAEDFDGEPLCLHLDLRHRRGHASGGLVRERGEAGNLPSGESYIVPYEGEIDGDPSRSRGLLPVQFPSDAEGGEVVVYRIEENRAVEVPSDGPESERERRLLAREPGYANLAELGLGVLADFGIRPIGEILIDEKLGLHIAFGRSDHFGGQVGAAQFSSPAAVVHIDRVYLPETQPRVGVPSADLLFEDGARPLMRGHRFVLWD
jgi:hypothetical protein